MSRERLKTPVCIVGAGISGLSAAFSCYDHSIPFVLVDAHSSVVGETSQCGGFLNLGYYVGIDDLEDMIGTELTSELWQLALESVNLLKNRIEFLKIDCDLELGGWLRTCLWSQIKEDLLYRYLETMQKTFSYQKTQIFDHRQISQYYAGPKACGFFEPDSGHIDVIKYVEGMKAILLEKNLHYYDSNPCHSIEVLKNSYLVHTDEIDVECENLILATGLHNYNLFKTQSRIYRKHYLISSDIEILDQEMPYTPPAKKMVFSGLELEQPYWRIEKNGHLYFGCSLTDENLRDSDLSPPITRALHTVFNRDLRFRISSAKIHDFTVNDLPFPDVMNPESGLFMINSFSGQGILLAGMTGELIVKQILGKSHALELFTKSPVWDDPAYKIWKTCEGSWKDLCTTNPQAHAAVSI
jgi:gamma-glutamylputrescine oxidase